MGRLRLFAPLILAAALGSALPPEARAQRYNGYQTSQSLWHSMDRCRREAWREHPDFTQAEEAARQRSVKQCLAVSNLPPAPSAGDDPLNPSGSSRQRQ